MPNAQASTGPRTDAGKQIVARNAIHPDGQTLIQTACDHLRALYPPG